MFKQISNIMRLLSPSIAILAVVNIIKVARCIDERVGYTNQFGDCELAAMSSIYAISSSRVQSILRDSCGVFDMTIDEALTLSSRAIEQSAAIEVRDYQQHCSFGHMNLLHNIGLLLDSVLFNESQIEGLRMMEDRVESRMAQMFADCLKASDEIVERELARLLSKTSAETFAMVKPKINEVLTTIGSFKYLQNLLLKVDTPEDEDLRKLETAYADITSNCIIKGKQVCEASGQQLDAREEDESNLDERLSQVLKQTDQYFCQSFVDELEERGTEHLNQAYSSLYTLLAMYSNGIEYMEPSRVSNLLIKELCTNSIAISGERFRLWY